MSRIRHITLPGGFRAAGVACGVKASGKKDVALLVADKPAAAAILTTQNQVVGAPVVWCRRILPRGYGRVRAMVINSGVANVCNGPAGLRDAEAMARQTARQIGAEAREVLVASTGVIGHPLPMPKIRRGIAAAAERLSAGADQAFVQAIMTTDTREKSAVVQIRLAGKTVSLAGVVKGAGMIEPNMATMISVITTDAGIAPRMLHGALRHAAAGSFNAITVDSDTSTSDTVAVLASGASGVAVKQGSPALTKFQAALAELCGELARAVVADGEGATRVVRVVVRGARSTPQAAAAAKTVANSPLVKTAVHGADPNWGRVVAALGRSAAKVDPAKLRVRFAGVCVFAAGRRRAHNASHLAEAMKQDEVTIDCDLGLGKGRFTALTCDLSREYITINADYHT